MSCISLVHVSLAQSNIERDDDCSFSLYSHKNHGEKVDVGEIKLWAIERDPGLDQRFECNRQRRFSNRAVLNMKDGDDDVSELLNVTYLDNGGSAFGRDARCACCVRTIYDVVL